MAPTNQSAPAARRGPMARLFRRSAPATPLPAAAPPISPAPAQPTVDLARAGAALEAEFDAAIAGVAFETADASRANAAAAAGAEHAGAAANAAQHAAGQASGAVAAVAQMAEHLVTACGDIAAEARGAADGARDVLAVAERAQTAVGALERVVNEIDTVTASIAGIAQRTNLLALNATIEAARAGPAGKGFAVVAGEVKALSQQTRAATEAVGRRIAEVRAAAAGSAGAITAILDGARGIGTASAGVSAGVLRQHGGLAAIARDSTEAATQSAHAADRVQAAAAETAALGERAAAAAAAVARVDGRVAELRAGVIVSLRAALEPGNPPPRQPVLIRAHLRPPDGPGAEPAPGVALELSSSRALLRLDGGVPSWARPDHPARLDLDGVGTLTGTIATLGGTVAHLVLDRAGQAAERLRDRLHREATDDARFCTAAQAVARRIEAALNAALINGALDEAALFDTDYRPIPGTDPPQHLARFTPLTDRVLPPLQEPMLAFDPRVVFCAAVDRNGYLPTHNAACSQPQRPGETAWNTAHARNRRIFDDRAGLAAARNTRANFVQCYERVMGGGQRIAMKECDAPITIRGRHWGALRLAYRAGG